MSDAVAWKGRFTAPRIADLRWASTAPDRLGVVTNESGTWQAWSWDLATGVRRQASHVAVGAEEVHVLPDGSGVVWWDDLTGDERGRWIVSGFLDEPDRPLVPKLPPGWSVGISMVPGATAVGLATDDDTYRVFVSLAGESAREVYAHRQPAGVGDEYPQGGGGLSADGTLIAIRHSEHGDIERTAVRVLSTVSGDPVADLDDGATRLVPVAWSPVAGDPRLVVMHERTGWERPAIWNTASGERTDLDPDLDGAVFCEDWFPDGSALLLRHALEGRDRLVRLDVATGSLLDVLDPQGAIDGCAVRPDGDVWARVHSSARPPRWVNIDGDEVARLPGDGQPQGRPARSFFFENPRRERIQGFVVTPEGDAPFPTIVSVHGGPGWHHSDGFDEGTQAYVDHGYAVVLVNYRGSTGYGRAFRESLRGDIGFPESEDVNAAVDHLIAEGVIDPARLYLEGWSWGGYQATLNAGIRPERWRAVCAGIPVGDYVAAHYECSPPLRAWDVAMFGGSPMDVPEMYHERNPMTYIDRVQAPILMIAGEHDSRCPLGQVMTYAHGLRARGKTVEVHLYPGGHHANDMAEQIRHVELTMDFFARHA
jgi:dienelactone hydrolase